MKLAINFILFQLGWFSCVLGAANGMAWFGPVVVVAVVAVHLVLSLRPGPEAALVVSAMLLGLIADTLLLATGWLSYPSGAWFGMLAPYWIVAMWGLFATTLNVSMRWIKQRWLLGALFGAIGGPLSYYAGHKLNAIVLEPMTPALLALGVAWAVAMPSLMWLSNRFDGVSPDRTDGVDGLPLQASGHA